MKSTFEPSPGWRSSLPWAGRFATPEQVMLNYYAGWFLDHATAGPRTIKEGREEQQFPDDTLKAAEGFPGDLSGPEKAESTVWQVFAYEHFSRFETANRVWPPLVPACMVPYSSADSPIDEDLGVLTYRRDYTAPGNARRKGESSDFCGDGDCSMGVRGPHMHYWPTV